MLKVKNEKDLLDILRVISSEAVSLTKETIKENADPTIQNYKTQYRADEGLYGDLAEQESEEEEVEENEEEAEDVSEEEPEVSEEEPEPDVSGDVGASFDSVVKAVNNLRAGKSLRDSSIKQQAQVYYDKLSEDERTTLLVFLNALSNIIAGQVDGKDAQDPSDPPASINISSGEEGAEEEAQPEPEVGEPADAPEEEVAEEEPEEDTTPPIKVNESQEIDSLRRKVRRMMLRD